MRPARICVLLASNYFSNMATLKKAPLKSLSKAPVKKLAFAKVKTLKRK